jgi:hypothetical protein
MGGLAMRIAMMNVLVVKLLVYGAKPKIVAPQSCLH